MLAHEAPIGVHIAGGIFGREGRINLDQPGLEPV
jgi:hypothetical protein